ncbi:hypothetical protein Syun_030767 [Stephania yunnanensis]|uniref:Uncharacterized protein n=1 Tax=Stephania yunnanensis TaxID=152371 RepID=A0AAP0HEJ0_9MAGN
MNPIFHLKSINLGDARKLVDKHIELRYVHQLSICRFGITNRENYTNNGDN